MSSKLINKKFKKSVINKNKLNKDKNSNDEDEELIEKNLEQLFHALNIKKKSEANGQTTNLNKNKDSFEDLNYDNSKSTSSNLILNDEEEVYNDINESRNEIESDDELEEDEEDDYYEKEENEEDKVHLNDSFSIEKSYFANPNEYDELRNADLLKDLSKLIDMDSIYKKNKNNTTINQSKSSNPIKKNEVNVKFEIKNNFNTNKRKSDIRFNKNLIINNNDKNVNKSANVNLFQIMPDQCFIELADVKKFNETINSHNHNKNASLKSSIFSCSSSYSSSFEEIQLNESQATTPTSAATSSVKPKFFKNNKKKAMRSPTKRNILIDKTVLLQNAENHHQINDYEILTNPSLFFNKIYTLIDSFKKLNYLNNNHFENRKQFEDISNDLIEWLIKNNYNNINTNKNIKNIFNGDEPGGDSILNDTNLTSISTTTTTLTAPNTYKNSDQTSSFLLSNSWPPLKYKSNELRHNMKSLNLYNCNKNSNHNEKTLGTMNVDKQNKKEVYDWNKNFNKEKFEVLRNKYIESKRCNKLLLNKMKKFKKSLNREFKVIPRNDYKALIIQLKRYQEDFRLENKEKIHLRLFYEEKIQLMESMLNEFKKNSSAMTINNHDHASSRSSTTTLTQKLQDNLISNDKIL